MTRTENEILRDEIEKLATVVTILVQRMQRVEEVIDREEAYRRKKESY